MPSASAGSGNRASVGSRDLFESPVPRAECGAGSRPETGLQGQVSDRESGRSAEGYTCNVEVVGHYGAAEGFEGAEWQHAWFDHGAY